MEPVDDPTTGLKVGLKDTMEETNATVLTSVIENFVSSDEEGELRAACSAQVVSMIASKQASVQELVRLLGPLLTSQEERRRASGTQVLSTVLRELPSCTSTDESVQHLVLFYCDRLQVSKLILMRRPANLLLKSQALWFCRMLLQC